MSKRWKDLERKTADILGGQRVTEDWTLFRKRPDVVAPLPDGRRLIVDCKAHKRHAHHRAMEKVANVYCGPADIPAIVTREPGQPAFATIPLEFLGQLLRNKGEIHRKQGTQDTCV